MNIVFRIIGILFISFLFYIFGIGFENFLLMVALMVYFEFRFGAKKESDSRKVFK